MGFDLELNNGLGGLGSGSLNRIQQQQLNQYAHTTSQADNFSNTITVYEDLQGNYNFNTGSNSTTTITYADWAIKPEKPKLNKINIPPNMQWLNREVRKYRVAL
jgi:hypothetical protein